MKVNLGSPETTPRDRCILLDVGYPWLVMGCWNDYLACFVYANLEVDVTIKDEGGYLVDSSYVTETANSEEVLGWFPIPILPERKVKKI
jgi:hypothetical protein